MYIKICKKCGCMSYDESQTTTISTHYWVEKDTLELKSEDNNSELLDGDVITSCYECESEDMSLLDLEEEQLKEIINMDDDKRKEWLTKYLVIQGVK